MGTPALQEAVAALEAALARGDPASAESAVQAALRACAELSARGERPSPAALSALQAAHARATAASAALRERIAGQLQDLGRTRRALGAYLGR